MKIVVMGNSGSGKSTLARTLAERYQLPVLHMDTVQFLPGWKIRPEAEKSALVAAFLETHADGWVIDGNYSKLFYERRTEEADVILLLLFGRLPCLARCLHRFWSYKGQSRPDMALGCNEKMDFEFAQWILWKGRTRKIRKRYQMLQNRYGKKVVVIRNQKQLDEYCKNVYIQ